jgi:hypothetical protein
MVRRVDGEHGWLLGGIGTGLLLRGGVGMGGCFFGGEDAVLRGLYSGW